MNFSWLAFFFRLLNAFVIQTFYVPDEYWQSVEVAHYVVFGYGHLTWEWRHRIRGFLHPLLFAFPFQILKIFGWDTRSAVIAAPKFLQALLTAVGDVYFAQFASRVVGVDAGRWATFAYLTNHFGLFSLPRTLSNSLETAFSIVAFAYFPWTRTKEKGSEKEKLNSDERRSTRIYLCLAAISVLVRWTAVVTWIPLWLLHLYSTTKRRKLIVDSVIVGSSTLALSVAIDSYFYGQATLAPWEFLKFNVFKGVANFYGAHPFHWYLTQGFPVILGPHVIPFLFGVYWSWKERKNLAIAALIGWIIFVYSLLGHKEFRFIFTTMPLAMCFVGVFYNSLDAKMGCAFSPRWSWKKRTMVASLTLANLASFVYLSLFHQRGGLDAMDSLARRLEKNPSAKGVSVLFLLPCHQHPYYSHLHLNVSMRFLSCEPNLDEIADHVDEADQFFLSPSAWFADFVKLESERIPSHVILSEGIADELRDSLEEIRLKECDSFFHTHFPLDERIGKRLLLFC